MNEREKKLGLVGDDRGVCSVTGRPCRCHPERGCAAGEPKLDAPSREVVRELKTARLYLECTEESLDRIEAPYELSRRYPCPEVREIRRKVVTAIALIDEIGLEL